MTAGKEKAGVDWDEEDDADVEGVTPGKEKAGVDWDEDDADDGVVEVD